MQNIAPTRKLNRRSRDVLLAAALLFLIGALLMITGIGLHIVNLVVPSNPGAAVYDMLRKAILSLGFGIAFVACLLALRAVSWKTDHALARQLGADLARHLDHNFVFIRNISRRRLGLIDAAIISVHGVLILRIIGRRGIYLNEGGLWLKRAKSGQWQPMRWNPTRETLAQRDRVRSFLQGIGIESPPLDAIIVFAHDAPQVQLTLRGTDLPVLHASQLPAFLDADYRAEQRLPKATVRRIANALYH